MRLTELQPRWIVSSADGGDRHGLGISFECPLHRQPDDRLSVWFANPVDGGAAHVVHDDVDPITHTIVHKDERWQRAGTTFDDLTLSPSVDASSHGCWHGCITNGDAN